jgi:hypothetical protein
MKIALTVVILALTASLALCCQAQSVEKAVPQDPAVRLKRQKETLAWNERTLVGAYDRVGKKSPRWDRQAREALDMMARSVSRVEDPPPSPETVRGAFRKAVEAGCDDPLIAFTHFRYNVLGPDASFDQPLAQAVKRLVESKYPSVRKATALYMSAARQAERAKTDPTAVRGAVQDVDRALGLMAQSFAEDGAGTPLEHVWLENLRKNVAPILKTTEGNLEAAYNHVDAALAKVPAAKSVRLIYRGIFYKEWAWEARGTGFADTVSPENDRKFAERLEKAGKAMSEAWKRNPAHSAIPTVMIEVSKGLGTDRQDMEQWFERAMRLDENNLWACAQKLDWLCAKWHGTDEEAIAFGRACRDTRNYRARIPLLLASAHSEASHRLPDEAQRRAYLGRDDVWNDLQTVFEEHLKQFPDDAGNRTHYAALACLARQYDEAARQFRTLGDRLHPDRYYSEEFLKRARDESLAKARTSVSQRSHFQTPRS